MGKGARTKGYIKNKVTNEILKFMFNPTTMSDSHSAKYSTIASCGSSYPSVHYVGGEVKTIPLPLYLNGSASEVQKHLDFIEELLPPISNAGKFQTPPHILLVYGKTIHTCVVTDKEREVTRYDSSLNPIEVKVDLKLTVIS